jgi:YegS/Rv2252/BmrU family lipid kinase
MIRDAMHRAGLAVDVAETTGPGHGTVLAREAVDAGWPLVVAVGGDGTVNEVVNGLIAPPAPARAELGVVMTGRGRDVCRNFGVPRDPRAAVHRLVAGRPSAVDVGWLEPAEGPRRCFLNAGGGGLDGVVARRTAGGGRGGRWGYVAGLLSALRAHHSVPVSLAVDGQAMWSGCVTTVVAANGACFGGGMRIAPRADPTDGRLDVIVVGALSRAELVAWLPALYRGWHVHNRKVTMRREVAVRLDAPLPLQVDGEPAGTGPARLTVLPAVLRLVR